MNLKDFKKWVKKQKYLILQYETDKKASNKFNTGAKIYAYVKGMAFLGWIDNSGRSNSFNAGDLIQVPPFVIESIIRDALLVEKDLEPSSVSTGSNYMEFNGSTNFLLYSNDDYYNGAYLINTTRNTALKVTDYVGSSKRCYFSSLTSGATGDKCYIVNIKGDDLIHYQSFDSCSSSRSSWKFDFSIVEEMEGYEILDQLCFESQTMLYKNGSQYKLTPIGSGSVVGTLSKPIIEENGNSLIDVSFSSIDDIFTDFEINYAFRPQDNKYTKKIYCNKNDSSSATYLGSTYINYCKNAEINYKISRKFVVNLDFVQDETTAYYFAQRVIKEHTFQKMIVGYVGNIENHIQYEKGDLVRINYSKKIPTSKNNSAQFLIDDINFPFKTDGDGEIVFKLVEQI